MKRTLIKKIMKMYEQFPSIDDYSLGEIFRHPLFTEGTPENRHAMLRKSAETMYLKEQQDSLDELFDVDLRTLLHGKTALDLGCFTGGRGSAWAERYRLKKLYGLDVWPIDLVAAMRYSEYKEIPAAFICSKGEELPFVSESLDAVISFDVFEHVQNVETVLHECKRILKPGGFLIVVFPSYYHPLEHHLSLVTRAPFVHYFFKGEDLIASYNDIISERGSEADWYHRVRPELDSWERCNTINGLTKGKFIRMIKGDGWQIEYDRTPPLLRGRGKRSFIAKIIGRMIAPFSRMRFFEEFLGSRVTYILRKPVL